MHPWDSNDHFKLHRITKKKRLKLPKSVWTAVAGLLIPFPRLELATEIQKRYSLSGCKSTMVFSVADIST